MTEADKSGIEADRVAQITCADCRKLLDVSHLPSFSEVKCPACGMTQIVPARFGGFLLIGRLGSGGMGVIYHAMDKELGRHVALKVMKRELGANDEFVQSFKHEARAAAALNHPNVVQIYSFGQVMDQFYIAMELVSGGRLDEMIADGMALEETRSLEIHLQVVSGLRAASEVGLVHGDIKPANILFGKNGEAKVVDFGLASYIGQQQQGGAVWGTPYYIAPEKARGKRVDFRSDIYSLGATLFHTLTGQPPFDGITSTDVVMARLNQPAPNLLDINAGLHPETAAMVARMLETNPTMRHPSYPALQIDMEAALAAARKPQRHAAAGKNLLDSTSPRPPAPGKAFLARAGIGVAITIGAAAIIGGGYAYHLHQLRIRTETIKRQQLGEAMEQGATAFERINTLADGIIAQREPLRLLEERIARIATVNLDLSTIATQAALEIDTVLDIINEAEDKRAMADIARQQLQAATNTAAIQEPAQLLETYCNDLREGNNVIMARKAAIEQIIAEADTIIAQTAADLEARDAATREARDAAARAAARAKAEKAAQELARRKAQEAARLRPRIIQSELDMVDRARGANSPLIAQRNFENAAQSIAAIKNDLTQPETQAYFQDIQEAYKSMARLKTFMIGAIQKAPYPEGWTAGSIPRDIIRANTQGLTITFGTAGSVDVTWTQVSAAQLVKIAHYYIGTSQLPVTERADLMLAIALFCYESGAFTMAETYAASACRINPRLKSDARRLMPGLVK